MKLKTLAVPTFVLMTSFASVANATSNNCEECQPAPVNTNINTISVKPEIKTDVVAGANASLTSDIKNHVNTGANSSASTGKIDIDNGSKAIVGPTTQKVNVGDNTQTVKLGDNKQVVGDNTQTVKLGDNKQVVGDTTQVTDASSVSQGNNTVVGGQSVNYSNTTKVGAITGAPNIGSQMVVGECKEGFTLSIGGGNPFTGSYGAGGGKTSKDDECIRERRTHQKELKQMSITHYEKIAEMKTNSNEMVVRIQGAAVIANTGMQHLCNTIPGTQKMSNPEHHACETKTTQAMDFLFATPAKPVVVTPVTKTKALGHKH